MILLIKIEKYLPTVAAKTIEEPIPMKQPFP
jgi:hypothetical protein